MRFAPTIARLLATGIAIALPCMAALDAVRQTPQGAPPAGPPSIALPEGDGKRLVERLCSECPGSPREASGPCRTGRGNEVVHCWTRTVDSCDGIRRLGRSHEALFEIDRGLETKQPPGLLYIRERMLHITPPTFTDAPSARQA
jgi:hypothetical protein